MVTDQQVRKLMTLIHTEKTLALAAAKAGMDEKTARKYQRAGRLPSQLQPPHDWRTRADPFAQVWSEIEQLLAREPSLEAKTIFDYLSRKYEGGFQEGQLRTLQRHVKLWRATSGPPREVFFPQQHRPGEQCQSDFTYMKELGVTISGLAFDHLFYHFTLTYSNWETGSICFSESFESLSAGLQHALWELGAVPVEHRSDSLSAAVNHLRHQEEFTARYQALLRHYGLRASHSSPGRAHENGDVEQSHYRFKQAVAQELMLRGSRDFQSRGEYLAFLQKLLQRRNAARQGKLAEELKVCRPLPERRLEDYTLEVVRVSRHSTISVKSNIYSVPSQLIGERVEVRIYAEQLEVWYGGQLRQQMERLRGQHKHAINYRHIIDSLRRKPGALERYCYLQDLFPRLLFRVAWDELREHHPATAAKQYVQILHRAATQGEELVHEALRTLVMRGEVITAQGVEQWLHSHDTPPERPELEVPQVSLSGYDSLLGLRTEVER
jgi:transposase InsO family protein